MTLFGITHSAHALMKAQTRTCGRNASFGGFPWKTKSRSVPGTLRLVALHCSPSVLAPFEQPAPTSPLQFCNGPFSTHFRWHNVCKNRRIIRFTGRWPPIAPGPSNACHRLHSSLYNNRTRCPPHWPNTRDRIRSVPDSDDIDEGL